MINRDDLNANSGFYAVNFDVFTQTLEESSITHAVEMGGGVTIHYGTRCGHPIWLMENPCGSLNGIWVEENERKPN